jgi:hypothetical protein
MKSLYLEWIQRNVTDPLGKCREYSEAMARAFPELSIVRGHYCCPQWGDREHWWLVDERGSIVDPTVDQFPSGGFGQYIPWTEGADEPTGKCIHCGEYCYHGRATCSPECLRMLCGQYDVYNGEGIIDAR